MYGREGDGLDQVKSKAEISQKDSGSDHVSDPGSRSASQAFTSERARLRFVGDARFVGRVAVMFWSSERSRWLSRNSDV